MSDRPAKPADTSWVSPYFMVRDADAAREFYQTAFGFKPSLSIPGPDGKSGHTAMTYRDIHIMFSPGGGGGMQPPVESGVASPMCLYFYVEQVDAAFRQAVDAGAEVVYEPQDMFWGDRVACVKDPDGYMWTMATNVGELDMEQAKAFAASQCGKSV